MGITARQSQGRAHGDPDQDENPDGVHAAVAENLERDPKAGSTPLRTSAATVDSVKSRAGPEEQLTGERPLCRQNPTPPTRPGAPRRPDPPNDVKHG